ncbi:MAG: histidine phosphatase family protein [Proteobacteria bacterium]|nr:histidine phosphatase family protein [Pseudomonadota bacterium]
MVAPTRLTWICHAATAATRRAAFPADEAIDDKGRAAARAIAGQIGAYDKVLVAPERRALQTAECLGLQAAVDPELRDGHYGRWTGRSLSELGETEPEGLALWLADPRVAPHGGESLVETVRRAAAWLDRHAREGARLIAVSHPAIVRAAIVHALQAPVDSFWRIDVPPLSRTRMSHDGRGWKVTIAGNGEK